MSQPLKVQSREQLHRLHEMQYLSNYCNQYDPCPICFKCRVKASHMLERCQRCPVPFCNHNDKQRNMMIRRENFAVKVSDETAEKLKEWDEQRCTCGDDHE